GTSLTIEQIQLVKRNTDNMKILYDGDAAGVKAALRGLDLVLEQDMNVRVVLLPDGQDPDSYLQEVGAETFKTYLSEQAQDFILFKASLLMSEAAGDPVKKTAMIKDIMSSVARIPDMIKRSLYTKECAALVQVDEEILISELNKIQKKNFKQEQKKKERAHSDSSFPSEEPHFPPGDPTEAGGYPGEEPPTPKQRPAATGHSFQERDVIRLLVTSGGEIFDEEQNQTVAAYILNNIEEVLDDFDNKLYERVARECLQLLIDKKEVSQKHFINHWDDDIAQLAVSILSSPDEYSPNWKDKHEIDLRTQPMPEMNFTKDSIYAINIFKLKKIEKTLAANQERIKDAQSKDDMSLYMKYLKVHNKLLALRSDLAKLTNTVIVK
ncbi:MAG: toprim domain-containing protein, partial [Saprospiraceae bacterium]